MTRATTGRNRSPQLSTTPPFETIRFEVGEDHVATITLDRPDVLNAFDQRMCDEFARVWRLIRLDDTVHAVVLRAAGERAFSTGVDVSNPLAFAENVWSQDDPGASLGPKANSVWKPVVCAVQGMAAGGAFYWINEADIVICSEDATFFDPHVTYGLTAALEPIGLSYRVPLGEALRIALMGLDERVSAQRALAIGLVTEVVTTADLWARAHAIASTIAAKPPAAVQGTVRAIWEALDVGRTAALQRGLAYTQIGNPRVGPIDRGTVPRPRYRLR
jgi:enoyl-CoA hydratase/carnithine racemase